VPLPEYETLYHFSALLENDDPAVVVEANRVCNNLGMDTISASATLACWAEIKGKSLSPEQIVPLLEDIGHARGVGIALGRGAAAIAEEAGKPEAAMTVKRQELPAYDPRGAYGMALSYAVSTRGGCHLRAYPISHEILRKPVATDRFSFIGKAGIIKIGEGLNAVIDSLTACKFTFFGASIEEYAHAFSAVTGETVLGQDLLKIGERIVYHERMMNTQNGLGAMDDMLPDRFFCAPENADEKGAPAPIDRRTFDRAIQAYYTVRGLDQNGCPTQKKIEELELEWKPAP
jgi:aldehyde:ferredoxin oxidoreductase